MSQQAEAQRQQALLQALWAGSANTLPAAAVAEHGRRLEQGLAAYRNNARAIAARALSAHYPTVQMLLGPEDLAALARELWLAHPPQCGDLSLWGAELAELIQAHAQLQNWPYLADCARLDWAVHQCANAADAQLDVASLSLLSSHAPPTLRLRLMPGLSLVQSAWPIGRIYAAHHAPYATTAEATTAERDAAFAASRRAIEGQEGETALIYRSGWHAEVCTLDAAHAAWMRSLLAGTDLASALHQHQAGSDGFDFSTWLPLALSRNWLWRIDMITPSTGESP